MANSVDKNVILYDWLKYSSHTIITGTSEKNERLLELFLYDFVKQFPQAVNAGCSKCLNEYINEYKKFLKMKNSDTPTKRFKLLEKRNGIPLEFGGDFLVTNDNITDELAQKLLERFGGKPEAVFEIYPEDLAPLKAEKTQVTKSNEPSKRKRRSAEEIKAENEKAKSQPEKDEKPEAVATAVQTDLVDQIEVIEAEDVETEAEAGAEKEEEIIIIPD